jgi:DNA-binding transcriptional ArsR family regulator
VTDRVVLLEEPDTLRGALAPLRRRLLVRLAEPASASQLAAEFGMGRQKVNYHLRKLEDAGFVEQVAQRQRRGFTERVLRARADTYVVDPALVRAPGRERDVVDVAAATVRAVARVSPALAFAWEGEVRLTDPDAFAEALRGAITEVVARFDAPRGRAYRVVGAGHPAMSTAEEHDDRAA